MYCQTSCLLNPFSHWQLEFSSLWSSKNSTIHPLQRIQNNSARLILKKKKSEHISPLLQNLHWLPVSQRILFKSMMLCYKAINNHAPIYLSSAIHKYIPSRSLRSASDPLLLHVPHTRLSTFGPRAFSVFAPSHWNKLPLALRQKQTLSSFKTTLKTYLYPQ